MTGTAERGQLILIGSLLVATTIVGSIVLLNSIHASPGVYAQQDVRSIDEVQRTVDGIQSDLERAFLVNTSMDERNESLPYAREGEFDALVAEYDRGYANLSTTYSAGLSNVTVLDDRSVEGVLARQNRTANGLYVAYPSPSDPPVVENAEAIPRLYLFVNRTDSSDPLVIRIDGSTTERIEVVGQTVRKVGAWECQLDRDTDIELSFTKGRGAVFTDETYCGGLDFGVSPGTGIDVTIENSSGSADGTYVVTGAGSGASADSYPSVSQRWSVETAPGSTVYVNPVFRVEYRNPDIAYNSTFALYNGTGR